MDRQNIRAHWEKWSETFGTDLRATTKTWTLKAIEVDALARRIETLLGSDAKGLVLEAGCGNGANCLGLAQRFPGLNVHGFDFVSKMVSAARENAAINSLANRLSFEEGDVLKLSAIPNLAPNYKIVFTDRCLINLNSISLQKEALTALAEKVEPGGYLLMIENSQKTYDDQNLCRTLLGLEPRTPAAFNTFFDENQILPHLDAIRVDLIDVEDFVSLHDIVLYVLVPAVNGGKVDYDHPIVEAATRLNISLSAERPGAFGAFGQNRLFVCRKQS